MASLRRALALHRAGQWAAAEGAYREVLEVAPERRLRGERPQRLKVLP